MIIDYFRIQRHFADWSSPQCKVYKNAATLVLGKHSFCERVVKMVGIICPPDIA